jgi:Ni2+-binding GTPase involved in maturation of urease and hydrogenase
MSDQKDDRRVIARTSARIVTQEEIAKVTGGEECHLPTSIISRGPNGLPRDITQD